VEEGPTEVIFQNPAHPYTQHLISSLPVIGEKAQKTSLHGTPPNLANPPDGCRFHPRCPWFAKGGAGTEKCKTEVPEMLEYGGEHRIACHLCAVGVVSTSSTTGDDSVVEPVETTTQGGSHE
jgi:peptide/nickel transport system ATP-binding protein